MPQTKSYTMPAVAAAIVVIGLIAFAMTRLGATEPRSRTAATPSDVGAITYSVHDTTVDVSVDASGIAAPIQQATLSTRLMGTVTDVQVREGARVTAGQVLVTIDARDLTAKSSQAAASIAEAEALHADALAQANRIRGLYADSAATRAQLDAVETGLARATAGLEAARAAATELGAVTSYAVIRAPFAGIVARRFADPGAFATPGGPLVTIQDVSTLRISATTTPAIARGLRPGQALGAQIEQARVRARIEGTVPMAAGSLYTINALVENPAGSLLAGSRASLALPAGRRKTLVVPASAIVRVGDLTGVTLRTRQGDDRRWVRLGQAFGGMVEVSAGLVTGDVVVLPAPKFWAMVTP